MMNTPLSIMEDGVINKPIAQKSLRQLAINDVIDTITEERIILDLFGGAKFPEFHFESFGQCLLIGTEIPGYSTSIVQTR